MNLYTIKILNSNDIKLENITKNFMFDFEKSLINSIKKNFENPFIDECFFHFVKLIWNKTKTYRLCKKDKIKNTKILIFLLKIIPFLDLDRRNDLFKKIEEYYNLSEDNYSKLVNYYKRNWINNPFINYNELSNKN